MYYVYILQSEKDKRTYAGHTKDLNQRLQKHNSGEVLSTKKRKPLKLIYFEKCISRKEAKGREMYWKNGSGRNKLKQFFNKVGFPPITE